MNKPATKGDIAFWSFAIIANISALLNINIKIFIIYIAISLIIMCIKD